MWRPLRNPRGKLGDCVHAAEVYAFAEVIGQNGAANIGDCVHAGEVYAFAEVWGTQVG